jgi:pimeloyl-ACP methyl ester carboxylesterase
VSGVLLVHGAGSGPWAFEGWAEACAPWEVDAVDLQAGLDVAHASIADYAAAVERAADPMPRPLGVVGWSLGGLVSLVAAQRVRPEALVLLEASPPREVQGERPIDPKPGTFMPDPSPSGLVRRPESTLAMGERDRGIAVPPLPAGTRALVVCGDAFLHDRGPALAAYLGADLLEAGAATHEDLVRDPELRERVVEWLRAVLGA